MNNKVLVTGANGFIGSNVVRLLASNYSVIASVRSLKYSNKLEIAEIAEIAEITGSTQWHDKLIKVNTIIHLAAVAHNNSRDIDYIKEVNVRGTVNLAKQAVEAGVKRFIFISSIGVLGNNTRVPFDENSPLDPHSEYAESKLRAELELLRISSETGLEVVIIRPVLVYGVDAPGNFAKLLGLVKKMPCLPFALCNNKRSFISIDNLVHFIITCISHPKAGNEVFCISDGVDLSIQDVTNEIAAGLNKKIIQLPVPLWVFKCLGKAVGKRELIEQLVGDLQVDSSKARSLLGWHPPVTMAKTLTKLVDME